MQKNISSNSSYLGCHPLFGDSLSSPVGQRVALVNFDENKNQHNEFYKFIKSTGLSTSKISSNDHDKHMAVVQGLTHFTYMSFMNTIISNGFKPSLLMDLKTPNYQFLYSFASRVMKLATTTTGPIQETPESIEIRKCFIQSSTALHNKLMNFNNVPSSDTITELKQYFTKDDLDEGSGIANIAVDSVQRLDEQLFTYMEENKTFIFKHKFSGYLYFIKIISIYRDHIEFSESTKKIKDENGKNSFIVNLTEQAEENYRKQGWGNQKRQIKTIKKRNIQLFKAGELDYIIKNKIVPAKIKRTFVNPHKYDEIFFESWLPLLVNGIWKVIFDHAYKKSGMEEQVTISIEFNPEVSPENIINSIENEIINLSISDIKKNQELQFQVAMLNSSSKCNT